MMSNITADETNISATKAIKSCTDQLSFQSADKSTSKNGTQRTEMGRILKARSTTSSVYKNFDIETNYKKEFADIVMM